MSKKIGICLLVIIIIAVLVVIALVATGKIFKANDNNNQIISKVEDNNVKKIEAKSYNISLKDAVAGQKIERSLNENFKIVFDVKEKNESSVSWTVSVNGGNCIYDDSSIFIDDEKTIWTISDKYLFYTNTDYTDIRSEKLIVVNKDGKVVKEIYELDDNTKGLVLSEFRFENDKLIVKASRTTHGPTVVVNEQLIESNNLMNVSKQLPVEADYIFTINSNGNIDFDNPKVDVTKTFEEFVKENRTYNYYDEKVVKEYLNEN